MIRKSILLGLLAAAVVSAGIKAAECAPTLPVKSYILLLCPASSQFLAKYLQSIVGPNIDVKIVDSTISAADIANAECVVFAINAFLIERSILDGGEFARQLKIHCKWAQPGEYKLGLLMPGLLSNPKQALIIHGLQPSYKVADELTRIFRKNVFQLSQESALSLVQNDQYDSLQNWLQAGGIHYGRSLSLLEDQEPSSTTQEQPAQEEPCCDWEETTSSDTEMQLALPMSLALKKPIHAESAEHTNQPLTMLMPHGMHATAAPRVNQHPYWTPESSMPTIATMRCSPAISAEMLSAALQSVNQSSTSDSLDDSDLDPQLVRTIHRNVE